MKCAVAVALLLTTAAPAWAEDPKPEAKVRVAWRAPERPSLFAGEVFELALVVQFDPVWLAEHAVTLFARDVDVSLEIEAHALRTLRGADVLPGLPIWAQAGWSAKQVAVNGEIAAAAQRDVTWGPDDVPDDDRMTRQLWIVRRFIAVDPGVLEVPAAQVRFAHASRFEEDALGVRVPVDRTPHQVEGQALTLPVLPLPEAGRPADFGGAIGRFALTAAAERTEVDVGQTFRFTLTIEGTGNVERFEAPRIRTESGFHVYGVADDRSHPKRTIVYDLAAQRADVTAIPAIELPVFDPEPPAAYRVLRTAPLGLAVRPPSRQPTIEAVPADAADEMDARGLPWLPAVAAALLLVGGLLWVARRRPRGESSHAGDAGAERLRAAIEALRKAPAAGDLSEAFAEVLAARLGQPRAAAIAPDIGARLIAVGVAPEDARAAAGAMESLVAARYGGSAAGPALRDLSLTIAARIASPAGQHRSG